MSEYIIYALIAYLLFAITGIFDKFLLSKVIAKPVVYAFYVGLLSSIVLVLAPLGLKVLAIKDLLIALLAGVFFTYALLFFYSAIQQTSISRVLPIEGGFVPLFTLVISYLVVGERLDQNELWAFGFLVCGSVLISFKKIEGRWQSRALKDALIAALFFAASLSIMKYVYLQTNFISGLIWTRLGLTAGALSFLLSPTARTSIFSAPKDTQKKNKGLFFVNLITGSSGGLLQSYAISIGSVAIVSAMQGIQFAFLLILTIALSLYFPKVLKEDITGKILAQKIAAVVLIAGGLILLSL